MNKDLIRQCANCNVCSGSGVQSIPMLGHGSYLEAPILAVGQNLNLVPEIDFNGLWWASHVTKDSPLETIELFSAWSFERSLEYKRLETILGPKWLDSGWFYWTHAIRCRLPEGSISGSEMIGGCNLYTQQLMKGRKALIVVGETARFQIFGDNAEKLEWGKLRHNVKLDLYVLAIRHPKVWGLSGMNISRVDEVILYADSVTRLIAKLKSEGVSSIVPVVK